MKNIVRRGDRGRAVDHPTTPLDWARRIGAMVLAITVIAVLNVTVATAFRDTAGNPHAAAIDALAAEGVTLGCGDDNYCPDEQVTREQAAAFLYRAFAPSTTSQALRFVDIGQSAFQTEIDALSSAGITQGCETDQFCPQQKLTRGEMATLIARSVGLPTGAPDRFWDDDGSVHEWAINAIAHAGITNGCSETKFCPNKRISRDEVATLLAKALDLEFQEPVVSDDPVTPTSTLPGETTTTIAGATTTTAPVTPTTAPSGDVYVRPGDSLGSLIGANPEGTVFVLAAGQHYVNNVSPKTNQRFIGEGGAIVTGNNTAKQGFNGSANGVVIDNLIFENYASDVGQSVIGGTGQRWTVQNSEIRNNRTSGLQFHTGWIVRNNYIHHNRQLGIKGYGNGALVEGNEIAFNNQNSEHDWAWEAGGSKFIRTTDLTLRNNYVHDNHGPGLWADYMNFGTVYEGNLVEDNFGPGIFHEVSGSATIRNNTLRRNADEFYFGGILVSASRDVVVSGNLLEGNDGGIVALQDNRGTDDNGVPLIVDNLTVVDNRVSFTSGVNGVWSNVGSAPYSRNITFDRNTYTVSGARPFQWNSTSVTWTEWRSFGHDLAGSIN